MWYCTVSSARRYFSGDTCTYGDSDNEMDDDDDLNQL